MHLLFNLLLLWCTSFDIKPPLHPIYVSVTTIEHNAKEKILEVSCRTFTDDFEKTLRKNFKGKIDLLHPVDHKQMDSVVSGYLQRHISIIVNGQSVVLTYVGYEQDEDGIMSYFEADGVSDVKEITVTDNILFDFREQQVSVIHATVNGIRRSTRLANPADKVSFTF